MKIVISLLCVVNTFCIQSYSQCDTQAIFNNDSTNAVCIDTLSNVLSIVTNNYPDHSWGAWPSNSPVSAQDFTYYVCAYPIKGDTSISMYDYPSGINACSPYTLFGVGLNGIFYAGWGAMWFVNPVTMQENTDWNVEPLAAFNMDFNNAHSNNPGEYHYHGTPFVYYQDSLGIDGTQHSPLIGYAADGFPVYYKYVYSNPTDPQTNIIGLDSDYSLKSGNRPGDGITEPDGAYDGYYVEDYEYSNTGPLDDCNGRFGITPEYPLGTYYYVITDNWPYFPRCFYGTVIDNSFRIGPQCPSSTADIDCSPVSTAHIELLEGLDLTVYPNPAGDYLFLHGDVASVIENISVYNSLGEVIFEAKGNVKKIQTTHWLPGTYFMQLKIGNQEVTRKIIKK